MARGFNFILFHLDTEYSIDHSYANKNTLRPNLIVFVAVCTRRIDIPRTTDRKYNKTY